MRLTENGLSSRLMSGSRARHVVLLALLVGGAWTCASDPLSEGSSEQEPPQAGSSSTLGGDAADPSACDSTPFSSAIPEGWVRFPGLPCDCDLWVAPSAGYMGPEPTWVTRSDGILELETSDSGEPVVPGSGLGDAYGSRQFVSFGRELGAVDGEKSVIEWIALSLPSNKIAFQAREPGGYSSKCGLYTRALSQGRVVHMAWRGTTGLKGTAWALAGGPVQMGEPDVLYTEASGEPPAEVAIGTTALGLVTGVGDAQFWTISLEATPRTATPVTTGQELHLLGGWDESLFVQGYIADLAGSARKAPRVMGTIDIWTEEHGLRPLLVPTGAGPGEIGSVCGLGTDGTVMVWTQYSAWDGATWQSIEVMKAAFTTDREQVRPVLLAKLPGGSGGCRPWRVGGGYAATRQSMQNGRALPDENLVVRLSDGQTFSLPEPPGDHHYAVPLYVTSDEIAIEQGANEGAPIDPRQASTIVRIPLEQLVPIVPEPDLP